jgi:seryl-tRNA synthetase
MFDLNLKISPAKKLNKEIEKEILKIVEDLKEKYQKQKKEFYYKAKSEKDKILVEVKSSSYSATDFLAQLDKHIREVLGRNFKTTINEIEIISYEIEVELEEIPKKEITIPFVKKIEFKKNSLKLFYDKISFANIKDQYVEKSIKLIKEKIKMLNYEGKDEFKEYVWEGKQRKMIYNGDPAIDLEKKDWIRRTDAKGQFIFGREFTALVNVMKELLAEKVYIPLGFNEMTFPKFEYWEITKKSGHAKNMYPNVYFVGVPKKSSAEEWQEIMDLYAITGEIFENKIKEKISMTGIMSYAQCPPFWPYLKNKIIDEKTLPLLIYDWSGPTYRNESGGVHGLDRIEEFHRIETLFVGTKFQIIETWKKLKESFIKFYDECLDLEIRVARVTPWWMAHAGIKNDEGTSEIGTFDFDIYLPYRGNRTKEWLEVQNDSSNGDKYPSAWNVRERNQEILWSGCAGASMERIIVSFLAQKGLDSKNWPKEVRDKFEKKMKNIKEIKFY